MSLDLGRRIEINGVVLGGSPFGTPCRRLCLNGRFFDSGRLRTFCKKDWESIQVLFDPFKMIGPVACEKMLTSKPFETWHRLLECLGDFTSNGLCFEILFGTSKILKIYLVRTVKYRLLFKPVRIITSTSCPCLLITDLAYVALYLKQEISECQRALVKVFWLSL